MGNRSGKTPEEETQSSLRSPTGQPSHSPPTTPQIDRPSQPPRDVETQLSKTSPISPPNPLPHSPPPVPPTDSTLSSLASSTVSPAQSLTISDLAALMRVLGEAPCSPRELGIQLGLDPRCVDALKKEALGDSKEFLSRVLQERLVSSQTLTLQTLLHVISRPPISDQDLAWRLQRDFTSDDQQEQLWKRKRNAPQSPAMADYSDYLDSVYKNAAIPPDPKGGPSPSTKFTNLALIKKEETTQAEADKFTKATLYGGIDQIMCKKKAIEMEDIFKPEEGQAPVKFVLVEGAPGVGKSTFAWELCRRRHEIEAMRAFSAVVLLRLREKQVKEISSLVDLLYHDDPDNEQAVARELRASKGENVLLILDGFDEVPASIRKTLYLAQVIRGQLLTNATVLVTSRPSARADLLSLCTPDKHIEVIGFTYEQVEEHASNIFGPNTPILADFLRYVSSNPPIQSMVYIPLNCNIVVEIYRENREEGRPIPQTMTQLYSELTLMRMRRHLKERGAEWDSLPRKLDNLPQKHPEVYDQLLSLAKVAFEGTLKQEVIFEELPAGCSSTLGLMTASQQLYGSCKGSSNYNFFHLTVQEFLSGFYVSQLPGSEQKSVFEQYSEDLAAFGHMDIVWTFVAGLTSFRDIGWQLVWSQMGCVGGFVTRNLRKGSDGEIRVNSFLVECLYEAQVANCESILGGSKVECIPAWWLPFSCFALGCCIAASRCSWDVDICRGVGPELLEMLVSGLTSQGEVHGSINVLNTRFTPIGQEGMVLFKKMPRRILQQLCYLDLSLCELDSPALDLLSDVIPTMTGLKYLGIDLNRAAGNGGTVKLLRTLANTHHLDYLSMREIPLSHDDIMALTRLISPSGRLRTLEVGDKGMQPNCVDLLLKTVLSPSSLQKLALWYMNINMTTLSFTPPKDNHNLTYLALHYDTVTSKDISHVAKILHSNTKLKYLRIESMCEMRYKYYYGLSVQYDAGQVTDSLRVLANALKVNRTLKELAIDINLPLGRDGAQALIDALRYNQTLEVLGLKHCQRFFSLEERRATDSRVKFVN